MRRAIRFSIYRQSNVRVQRPKVLIVCETPRELELSRVRGSKSFGCRLNARLSITALSMHACISLCLFLSLSSHTIYFCNKSFLSLSQLMHTIGKHSTIYLHGVISYTVLSLPLTVITNLNISLKKNRRNMHTYVYAIFIIRKGNQLLHQLILEYAILLIIYE